jgi:hypothetical protein
MSLMTFLNTLLDCLKGVLIFRHASSPLDQ